ncbi:MAG TPA: hypothetical protein VHW26_04195, partial [Solirubrobacteraceae bacterium]|nr:hypothetical protein [Solirubrobacteraceae bacterium]
MPDLSTIRGQVQDRLKELEELIAPLRAELEELTGVAEKFTSNGAGAVTEPARRARRAAKAKQTSAPKAAAPRKSRRAGGGGGGASRAEQAITLIDENPGMTVPDMAKAMGIGSNYLYRVLPALEKDGKVTKQGKG